MTHAETIAAREMDEYAAVVMAALDGSLEALTALMNVATASAYVDGMRDAAQSLGVTL